MTILTQALGLILSLSILVFVHELGHYMFARIFKTRIDKFYLFFNPKFSLMRAKKINGKWQVRFLARNIPSNLRQKLDEDGNIMTDSKGKAIYEQIPPEEFADDDWRKYPETTEWGIGWLPLGGYCAIAGMIDETKSADQLSSEPQPWEFRSKPAWQRLFIILGGVLVNFVVALMIYAGMLFHWGEEYIPMENATYGMQFSKTALECGFQNGDKIITLDGKHPETEKDFFNTLMLDNVKNVVVDRNGQQITVPIPGDFKNRMLKEGKNALITYRFPFVLKEVLNDSPAQKAGLMAGDSLTGINDSTLTAFYDFQSALANKKSQDIALSFYRNGKPEKTVVHVGEDGKIGVAAKTIEFFKTKKIEYGFFESIPTGISRGFETLANYVKQFKLIFTKEGASQLGGFGAIGGMFPKTWDWERFWGITALLSLVLAFMNFLPIPALDGGHFLFILVEMISGRKPGDKFLERAQAVGFFLLLFLLLYANGMDIIRAFFK